MSYPNDPNNPNQYGSHSGNQPDNQGNAYGQQPYPQQPYGGYGVGQPAQSQIPPENNMVWAVLATVLCCLPLGIVAIFKANSVNSLWAQGDQAGAHRAAEEAKKWAMWSAIASVVIAVIGIILWLVVFAVAVNTVPSTTTTYTY